MDILSENYRFLNYGNLVFWMWCNHWSWSQQTRVLTKTTTIQPQTSIWTPYKDWDFTWSIIATQVSRLKYINLNFPHIYILLFLAFFTATVISEITIVTDSAHRNYFSPVLNKQLTDDTCELSTLIKCKQVISEPFPGILLGHQFQQ